MTRSKIRTSGAEGLTLSSTDITIASGDLLFGTSAKGVNLGVTSNTDGNTLDDYEEGDWTPAVQAGGWGLSTTMARYTKVGRLVTVMTDTSLTGSGNSSDLIISGLPFTNSTVLVKGSPIPLSLITFKYPVPNAFVKSKEYLLLSILTKSNSKLGFPT